MGDRALVHDAAWRMSRAALAATADAMPDADKVRVFPAVYRELVVGQHQLLEQRDREHRRLGTPVAPTTEETL